MPGIRDDEDAVVRELVLLLGLVAVGGNGALAESAKGFFILLF